MVIYIQTNTNKKTTMKLQRKLQALQNRLDRYISKAVKATKAMILDLIFEIAKLERMIEVLVEKTESTQMTVDDLLMMLKNKGKGLRFFHKGNFSDMILNVSMDEQLNMFVKQLKFFYFTSRLENNTIDLINRGTARQVCTFLLKFKHLVSDSYQQTLNNIKHLGFKDI